jgi:hypothetical protein
MVSLLSSLESRWPPKLKTRGNRDRKGNVMKSNRWLKKSKGKKVSADVDIF